MSDNRDLTSLIEGSSHSKNPINDDIDRSGLPQQELIAKLSRYQQDTQDRKWLAIWASWTVSLWLSGVMLILLFNKSKFSILGHQFSPDISENVLISLLATTTLNVLGLIFIVLRGHFGGAENSFSQSG